MVIADDDRDFLIFDRRGRHTVRLLLHMGDGFIDTENYCREGNVLLSLQSTGNQLGKYGVQIILID